MWKDPNKPPVGAFEECAQCRKKFTVVRLSLSLSFSSPLLTPLLTLTRAHPPLAQTKYTVAVRTGGFLCHPCAKAGGADPFKKPAAPRKRKGPADKRTVTHFEERHVPSLASLCVRVVTKHIDDVEALGDIGGLNMDEIAKAIAKDRSL